jgi:Undecaprenyl-phosphate galactose phosphotransferase, WbaP/exopolysaccharide biosynthesis polyprenyl glycosylphosphotransferase
MTRNAGSVIKEMDVMAVPVRAGGSLRRHAYREWSNKLVVLGIDALALLLALFLGRIANYWWLDLSLTGNFFHWNSGEQLRLAFYLGLIAIVLSRFLALGHYTRRKPFWDELRETFKILLIAALVDTSILFLNRVSFSRTWLLDTWILAFLLLPLMRILVKHALRRMGEWSRPTIIIGTGQNAQEAAAALASEPLLGFDVIAFLVPQGKPCLSSKFIITANRPIPILPMTEEPEATIARLGYPHVVVALEPDELLSYRNILERLCLCCPDVSVVPAIRGLPVFGMVTTHFFSHEVLLLRARNNLARLGPRILKRIFDVCVASTALIVLSPLFAYIAWGVRRTGKEIFYCHGRIGMKGKPFLCYKFCSMVPNADRILRRLLEKDPKVREEWERKFKLKNDPRITPIGAFLRKTSLDELPQLWNVLKGEMSLAGPRPVIEDELKRYGDQAKYYLEVRPGITGLWQVSGRNDIDYTDRVTLDVWYVRNWSLWYDIVILLKTCKALFQRNGAY